MTSTRDVTSQSDFNRIATQPDGSFKRAPSSFRSTIEKGDQFDAEAGKYMFVFRSIGCTEFNHIKIDTISMSPTHVVSTWIDQSCCGIYSYKATSLGNQDIDHSEVEGAGGRHL
jgi:hypothetical protein